MVNVTLEGFKVIPGRYFNSAGRNWWAFLIGEKFGVDPFLVMEWVPERVMEALAYIEMSKPKGG